MREIIMEETQEGLWKPENNISRLKRFLMPWRANSERKEKKELDPGDAWVRIKMWEAIGAVAFVIIVYILQRLH